MQLIVAGHQPNYLPWLGFFDKMRRADVFIIEDNFQFERQGFTNRNRVKVLDKVMWLTVPIEHVGRPQLINEVRIANRNESKWAEHHWSTLKFHYCKAPFWSKYSDFFEQTYSQKWDLLIDLNMHLIRGIMGFLKINTPLVLSSSLGVSGKKNDLLIAQCKAVGATVHLSGVGAREYLDVKKFENEGIKVVFQDFQYPVYRQVYGEFVPNLSVVDYLFCTGGKEW